MVSHLFTPRSCRRLAPWVLILAVSLPSLSGLAGAWLQPKMSCCAGHGGSCCLLCKLRSAGDCGGGIGDGSAIRRCHRSDGDRGWFPSFDDLRVALPAAAAATALAASGERLVSAAPRGLSTDLEPPTPPPRLTAHA